MAINAKVGSFNTGTGVATTTIAVTGVGFTPKIILFWWSGRTETVDTAGRATKFKGFGYAISTSDRRSATGSSLDAGAAADSAHTERSAACVVVLSAAGVLDGLLDLNSLDADGFTVVVDDQFTASYRIHYLALAGSELTNVVGGAHTLSVVGGNQSNATLAFQPDFIIFFGGRATTEDSVSADDSLFIGAAKSSSNRYVTVGGSNDAATTMQTISYLFDGECIAQTAASMISIGIRFDFVSFNTDGFTINNLEGATATIVYFIAFKGMSVVLGDLLTQTDTTTSIVESGFGFDPAAVLLVSHNKAKSTQDIVQDDDQLTIGAFTSPSDRVAMGVSDDDNVADSVVATAVEYDECYINLNPTDGTLQGLMDVTGVGNGFTCIMDDADPAQAFVWYMAFGPAHPTARPRRAKQNTLIRM